MEQAPPPPVWLRDLEHGNLPIEVELSLIRRGLYSPPWTAKQKREAMLALVRCFSPESTCEAMRSVHEGFEVQYGEKKLEYGESVVVTNGGQ